MKLAIIAKNAASAEHRLLWGLAALLVLPGTGLLRAAAQDIKPVSSGAVQSVHFGISARVQAGTIARGLAGEQAGAGGFGVSESGSRVVSGKVAGYGGQQVAGRLGEYAPTGSGIAGGRDFPDTDFVASMPRPFFGASSATPVPAGTGFGVTLSPPAPSGRARHASSSGSHGSNGHSHLRSSDAIANPFTHPIASGLGLSGSGMGSSAGSLGGIGLGSGAGH